MKLKTRLVALLLPVVIVPMFFIGVSSYLKARNALEEEALQHVRLVSFGKEAEISEYLENRKDRAVDFAGSSVIRGEIEKFIVSKREEEKARAVRDINRDLQVYKKPLHKDFIGIHILDLEGRIIASTDENEVGRKEDEGPGLVLKGKEGVYLHGLIWHKHFEDQYAAVTVSAPIRSLDGTKLLAVLVNDYDPAGITEVISGERYCRAENPLDRLETGTEITLVDQNRMFLLSASEERSRALTGKKIETEPVLKCQAESREMIGAWLDPSGKTVWGASMCLQFEKDWKWTLLVEQDESKALAHISILGRFLIMAGIITLLAVILVASFLAKSIAGPISLLQQGAEIIGSGNLDYTVGTAARDEIGQLSRAFDRMTEQIRGSYATLKESEEKFRGFLATAQDAMILINNEGTIDYWNAAAEKMFGYTAEEVLGRDCHRLLSPGRFTSAYQAGFSHFKETGEGPVIGKTLELAALKKDGAEFSLELSVSSIRLKGAWHAIGIARDITERKRADEERLFHSQILENLVEGVCLIRSADGIIAYANASFERIFGYAPGELLGKPISIINAPDERYPDETAQAIIAELRTRGFWSGEVFNIRKDGTRFWCQATVTTLRHPKYGEVWISAHQDITEWKLSQEQLTKYHEHLEELVEERTLKLTIAQEDLTRSNQELEQFAYVASHDLQEPLRMISSFLSLLAKEYRGRLSADADQYIHYAVDGATRLQAMINDLLAFSRVGSRGNPPVPTDCELALQRALDNLKLLVEESGAEITHDPLPIVSADPTQLTQVLQNLVENGIKYRGEERSRIHLAAVRKDGGWLFSVADNGIGIDPKHRERIFQVFQRLHRKGKYAGTGIGLAVCRRIIERHGGRIWVESEPGKGSVFFFTIPG